MAILPDETASGWFVTSRRCDPAQAQLVRSTVGRGRQLQEQKLFPGEDLITVELFSPEPAAH